MVFLTSRNKPNHMKSSVYSILIVASIVLFPFLASSQNPDSLRWKRKLNFALNFNQAAFSSNWKAGGVNSIGLSSLFNYKANYKHGKSSWDNEIDLAYG